MTARRDILRQAAMLGLGATGIGLGQQAQAQKIAPPRAKRRIIIDALGSMDNPNRTSTDSDDTIGIDARSLADAKVSGLSAFNMTIGFVFGKDDPFETSVREVAAWDAFIRRHPDSLIKVQTVADIRRAHEHGRTGVCLLYTSPSPRDRQKSRMPSSA